MHRKGVCAEMTALRSTVLRPLRHASFPAFVGGVVVWGVVRPFAVCSIFYVKIAVMQEMGSFGMGSFGVGSFGILYRRPGLCTMM